MSYLAGGCKDDFIGCSNVLSGKLWCSLFSGVFEDRPVQQSLGGSVQLFTYSRFLFQKTDLAQEPKVSGAI